MKTIQLVDFHNWITEFGREGHKAIKRGCISGAMRCIPLLHKNTDFATAASINGSFGAVNTGAFKRGWRSTGILGGARVYNSAAHAPNVERGRKPGSRLPPTTPIRRWAQRKLNLSPEEAKAAAPSIARAISRRGLKGRRILNKSINRMTNIVLTEVKHELELLVDKL